MLFSGDNVAKECNLAVRKPAAVSFLNNRSDEVFQGTRRGCRSTERGHLAFQVGFSIQLEFSFNGGISQAVFCSW